MKIKEKVISYSKSLVQTFGSQPTQELHIRYLHYNSKQQQNYSSEMAME